MKLKNRIIFDIIKTCDKYGATVYIQPKRRGEPRQIEVYPKRSHKKGKKKSAIIISVTRDSATVCCGTFQQMFTLNAESEAPLLGFNDTFDSLLISGVSEEAVQESE